MGATDQSNPASRSALRAWLQLLRLPNLLTVPGDPVAGFCLAGGAASLADLAAALPAAGISLCLYAAGLLQNDYFDLAEDRRDRPSRPLPSGQVRPAAAIGVAVLLFALALGGSLLTPRRETVLIAAALVVAITLYNRFTKALAVIGPVNMGLCRGLSVLLGASTAGAGWTAAPFVWLAAGGVTAYIAAVTAIARRETRRGPVGARRNLPPAILAFTFASIAIPILQAGGPNLLAAVPFFAAALAAVAWAGRWAVSLAGHPVPARIQRAVGRLVVGLILVQAALAACAGTPGVVAAAVLVLLLPAAWLLGRWFYGS